MRESSRLLPLVMGDLWSRPGAFGQMLEGLGMFSCDVTDLAFNLASIPVAGADRPPPAGPPTCGSFLHPRTGGGPVRPRAPTRIAGGGRGCACRC